MCALPLPPAPNPESQRLPSRVSRRGEGVIHGVAAEVGETQRPAEGLPGWGVCPEFRASLTDRSCNSSFDGWRLCCRPSSLRAVSVVRGFTRESNSARQQVGCSGVLPHLIFTEALKYLLLFPFDQWTN